MRFLKALATVASLTASSTAIAAPQICVERDAAARSLTVTFNAGCISTTIGFPYQDMMAAVDAHSATIAVTAKPSERAEAFAGKPRIVTADCMGGRGPRLMVEGVDARRYMVTFNGAHVGVADLLEETKACTASARRNRGSVPGIDGSWHRLEEIEGGLRDKSNLSGLIKTLIRGFPGEASVNPEITFSISADAEEGDKRVILRMTAHGLRSRGMSGLRAVMDIRKGDRGWSVERIWAKYMPLEGPDAGRWTATPPKR